MVPCYVILRDDAPSLLWASVNGPSPVFPDYWSTRWSFHLWRSSLPASFILHENLDLPKAILTPPHKGTGQTYLCSRFYRIWGFCSLFLRAGSSVYGQCGHKPLPSNPTWLQADLSPAWGSFQFCFELARKIMSYLSWVENNWWSAIVTLWLPSYSAHYLHSWGSEQKFMERRNKHYNYGLKYQGSTIIFVAELEKHLLHNRHYI